MNLRETDKNQTTSRPDHKGTDAWTRIAKPADPSDEEYRDITKNCKTKVRDQRQLRCHAKERSFRLANGDSLFQKKKSRHLKGRLDSVVSLKRMKS